MAATEVNPVDYHFDEDKIKAQVKDALAVFSDDELMEELDRRGWEGELSRRQIVTIGAKA